MYSVLNLNSPDITDAHWQRYFQLLRALHQRYLSPFSNDSWEKTRDRIRSMAATNPNFHRMVMVDGAGEMQGSFMIRAHNVGQPHQVLYMDCSVFEEAISGALTTAMALEVGRLLDLYCSDHLVLFSVDERSARLGEMLGGQKLNRVDRYRLFRETANHDLMARWLAEIPPRDPEIRMEFHPEIPDRWLSEYCRLMGQFVNEMPTESDRREEHFDPAESRLQIEWRRKNNVHFHTCLLFHGDELIGFSSANINGSDPSHVFQLMTGVQKPYRGHDLAKWLKAAMFKRIGEEFPSFVSFFTDMRAVNEPIQYINARMGYVLESRGGEYKITHDGLTRLK